MTSELLCEGGGVTCSSVDLENIACRFPDCANPSLEDQLDFEGKESRFVLVL